MPALRARPLRSYVSAALFSERKRVRRQYVPPAEVLPLHRNDLPRALLCTQTAVCTLVCIDMCQEVVYSDSACLAVFLAEAAADTAYFTD